MHHSVLAAQVYEGHQRPTLSRGFELLTAEEARQLGQRLRDQGLHPTPEQLQRRLRRVESGQAMLASSYVGINLWSITQNC